MNVTYTCIEPTVRDFIIGDGRLIWLPVEGGPEARSLENS